MSSRAASPLECFCGRTYSNGIDLEEHRRARGHFPSHVCGKYCNHPRVAQENVRNLKCGGCGKICERPEILEDHCIVTGHCFCPDCDLPFESESALKIHRQTEVHASEFKCCDCNIFFKDIHALNAHMASRAHRKPLPQKPPEKAKNILAVTTGDRVCNKCRRTFSSSQALRQHHESVKHKPLSALSCPLGKGCEKKFTSPSALLHHLESGNCRSGMNRNQINHIVQSHDPDNVIYSLPALEPLGSPTFSAYSEISTGHSDEQSEWSLITPALSQGSVEDSLAQWSLLEGSDIPSKRKLQCPICPKNKGFSTASALQQHMNSPVHSARMYHCPSIVFRMASSKIEKKAKKEKHFSTLSGLTQHLESGACQGGKRTLSYCMDLIQQHLERFGFGGMRLLLPSTRS